MSEENRRIVLASRPQGVPTEDNFRLDTAPIPDPKGGRDSNSDALLVCRSVYAWSHECRRFLCARR